MNIENRLNEEINFIPDHRAIFLPVGNLTQKLLLPLKRTVRFSRVRFLSYRTVDRTEDEDFLAIAAQITLIMG